MSNEKFKPPYTANTSVSSKSIWNKSRIRLRFEQSCFKQQDKTPFTPSNVVNFFIVYELDTWSLDLNTDFTLGCCLFGSVKPTKKADSDKYKFSSYDIRFDSRSNFSLTDGSIGKNVIIFGVDKFLCYYHVTFEFQSESTLYSLCECQGTPCSKQAPYLKFKWQQQYSNPPTISS